LKIDSTRISRILNLYMSKEAQIRGVKKKDDKADQVVLSDKAHIFQEALKAAKTAPDVRMAKVEEIKVRVQSGQYRVDSWSIASKMVDDLLKQDR